MNNRQNITKTDKSGTIAMLRTVYITNSVDNSSFEIYSYAGSFMEKYCIHNYIMKYAFGYEDDGVLLNVCIGCEELDDFVMPEKDVYIYDGTTQEEHLT